MKHSTQRILTTHTGSLPRPADLQQMLVAQDRGEPLERAAFEARVRAAVQEVVQRQVHCGIDVVNDGEMSKISYSTYVKDRLTGFEGQSAQARTLPPDIADFPGYAARLPVISQVSTMPACNGPVGYRAVLGEPVLPDARSVSLRPGRGDEGRIRCHRGGRIPPATGLPRSRRQPGTWRGLARGLPRLAHPGAQPGRAGYPAGSLAAPSLLGQLRGATPSRYSP